MDKTKLAEAVAALLPDDFYGDGSDVKSSIESLLRHMPINELGGLAFECHKVMRAIEEVDCSCDIFHSVSNDGMTVYAYGLEEIYLFSGAGDTEEEAIFNAVIDWHSKEVEDVDNG